MTRPTMVQFVSTCVVVVSILVSYVTTRMWRESQQPRGLPATARVHSDTSNSDFNPFALDNGMHLIAFAMISSECGWSTLPQGMDAIRTVRSRMISEHGDTYAKVSVVGVAVGMDLDAELQFLFDLRTGTPDRVFDQVSIGASWLNEQAVRFYWRERAARALTPQIIVIERPVDTMSYASESTIEVGDDTISTTVNGLGEILTWLDNGVPVSER